MSSKQFSSRPATKRVRSDRDHSKADTKQRESDRQSADESKGHGVDGDEGDGRRHGHKDDDWLSMTPFQVGKSWEGWVTKWRESCWCGKSEWTVIGSSWGV
jgi:hypothetical protein